MLKELFKGSAIYGIAPFVPKLITVLLMPIMTKYLTSTDYGIIGTITSIIFVVQALQDLGLKVLLPNYFYKCPGHYKVIWREVYGFLSLWMIVFALIQSTLLYFFIPQEAESNKWLIIILSNFSTVFFGPTAILGQMYYQLSVKPTPVACRIVLSGVTTILVNFLCVVVFKWGYMGAYVGSFAGTFLSNLTYWPVLNRKLGLSPIYNFKFKTIRRLLKVSMPTIPHYYTSYLMNSTNVVAMNYHGKTQAEIGHLTMAQSMSGILETAITAVNQVFSPMSYRFMKDNDSSEMKRMTYVYILIAYTITFLFSLWAREVYDILISNEEIASTYKYAVVLAMAFNYRPLYIYCCNYFFYHERTTSLLGISFTAGLISCVFYFVMIPYMGIWAALWGFYLGCLYYGYIGYSFKFYKQKSIFHIKWYWFLLLQLFLTSVAFVSVDFSIIIKIFISIVYIAIGLVLMIKINHFKLNFILINR